MDGRFNNNHDPCLHPLLNRYRRWLPRTALIAGCGCALALVIPSAAQADSHTDDSRLTFKVFSGEAFNSTRPVLEDSGLELDTRPSDFGARLSGAQGRFLWNLNLTSLDEGLRPLSSLDKAMTDDLAARFGPAPMPGGRESWSLSAGWALSESAAPTVVFAGLGYSPRHWVLDDLGANGAPNTGDALTNTFQYGLGVTTPVSSRMSLGLSYAQRRTVGEFDPGALLDDGADAAIFGLGLSYGSKRDLWSTSFTASMGAEDRAPDIGIGISIRFPCCR